MNKPDKIILILKGETDKVIVEHILRAAAYPLERFAFVVAGGKEAAIEKANNMIAKPGELIALLVDTDEFFSENALSAVKKQLVNEQVEVFFAVPETEAWLFADDKLALEYASPHFPETNGNGQTLYDYQPRRLPLPEEIVFPKALARVFFGKNSLSESVTGKLCYCSLPEEEDYSFLQKMDISRAVARSFSLSNFLRKLNELLDLNKPKIEDAIAINIDLKIISNLLKEVFDKNTVVFRCSHRGNITAGEMVESMSKGEELGRSYAADLLRISRNFLTRKANKQ